MSSVYKVNIERGSSFYLEVRREEDQGNRRDRLDEGLCHARVHWVAYSRDVTSEFVIPNTGLVSDDGSAFRQRFRAAMVGHYWIHFYLMTLDGYHSRVEAELNVREEEMEPVPVREKPRIRVIRFRRKE